MGTNYYKVKKKVLSESDKAIIQKALDEGKLLYAEIEKENFDYISRGLGEYGPYEETIIINNRPEIVHLGKASCGWKFLWNHNNWKYYNDKESLYDYIRNTNTGKLYDEYGKEQDVEEFIKYTESKNIYVDPKTGEEKEAWDTESYYKEEYTDKGKPNPFNTSYQDIYKDGLRFSCSTEFC